MEGQDRHTQFNEQQTSFKKNMDQLVFQYEGLKVSCMNLTYFCTEGSKCLVLVM